MIGEVLPEKPAYNLEAAVSKIARRIRKIKINLLVLRNAGPKNRGGPINQGVPKDENLETMRLLVDLKSGKDVYQIRPGDVRIAKRVRRHHRGMMIIERADQREKDGLNLPGDMMIVTYPDETEVGTVDEVGATIGVIDVDAGKSIA
jgi:hypothetical protein